ncbi:unnamed protein product, partial [Amoebophrya sp. A120]
RLHELLVRGLYYTSHRATIAVSSVSGRRSAGAVLLPGGGAGADVEQKLLADGYRRVSTTGVNPPSEWERSATEMRQQRWWTLRSILAAPLVVEKDQQSEYRLQVRHELQLSLLLHGFERTPQFLQEQGPLLLFYMVALSDPWGFLDQAGLDRERFARFFRTQVLDHLKASKPLATLMEAVTQGASHRAARLESARAAGHGDVLRLRVFYRLLFKLCQFLRAFFPDLEAPDAAAPSPPAGGDDVQGLR